ncbi:MAG: lamin tail domain-containing protein [Saprospiraceae bacterium]
MNNYFASLLLAFLIPAFASGQFIDHFSDGNLDEWEGDMTNFIINGAEQLQLNAPSGSTTSFLYTTTSFEDSMEWEIYFRLDFAPSTSNQFRIYLGLTTPDIATASGYYLEIGASGDMDAIELKYLNNGSGLTIASSTPGLVGSEPVEMHIRVIKKSDGTWECLDISPGTPQLLFSVNHDLIPLSTLTTFGLHYKYTDTRRDKFFVDDVVVQPLEADITAPSLTGLKVIDQNTLQLIFDEHLDQNVAMNPTHYNITPGNLVPSEVVVQNGEVLLSFDQDFVSQQEYTLTVSSISDMAGNVLLTTNRNFVFTLIDQAGIFNLIITEIMADPTPVIGLPDAEYIEIFNNSNNLFDISDYTLRVGTSNESLPDSVIEPGEYLIIADDEDADLFADFGKVIAVESLPGLTNSGTTISIINESGTIIHQVDYDLTWYNNPLKSNGGWSLEMINPLLQCAAGDNWAAADTLLGGTPGGQNSQWVVAEDQEGPAVTSVYPGNADVIELRFDEKIDETLMANPDLFTIDPLVTILSIEIVNSSVIRLHLSSPLNEGVIYSLLPFQSFDCLGNVGISDDTIRFGLVATPVEGDLLINEILFNPVSGGSRFIEVINASPKFIDLSKVSIGRIVGSEQDIYLTGINEILNPGEIATFSPVPGDIMSRYTVPNPQRLYESDLPSWDDQMDNVSIIFQGIILDSFTYTSAWHHPVISDQNGVSLERISVTAPSNSSFTWHSASSLAGYGTPTGVNSQLANAISTENPFTIENRNFSPNGDGNKDFLSIHFELQSGNIVGSVWVYDLEGREIHEIIENEILGTSSQISWDGRTTEGRIAEMGIYIIYLQLWDADGNVNEYKETCALIKR